jgi:hypothetical protein
MVSSIWEFAFKGRVDGVLVLVQVCVKLKVGVHTANNLELFLLALRLQIDIVAELRSFKDIGLHIFLVDRGICQIGKFVMQLIWIIIITGEPEVVLGVEPDF